MGRSDLVLTPFYRQHIKLKGEVALLGFTKNDFFRGDLYDKQLGNWNINSDWSLPRKYDTIISLRCPYFARDPEDFIKRCYDNLNPNGYMYIDWGLGDHWRRFKNYKVGWVKEGEHENAYEEDNYLWSTVWDDSFLLDEQLQLFSKRIKKFGYLDIKKAIMGEVPRILEFNYIGKYFEVSYDMLALWEDRPQLYILVKATKRG